MKSKVICNDMHGYVNVIVIIYSNTIYVYRFDTFHIVKLLSYSSLIKAIYLRIR